MTDRSHILIVDDEPFNVDYLEQELADLGFSTERALSGRDALEKLADRKPDLVLLDVMMPGLDGYTVCRMIKEDRSTRLIPVIFMTSLGDTDDRIKGIEAGGDDFLTKPVDERELFARINTALKQKKVLEEEIGELRLISDHLAKFVPNEVKRRVQANPQDPDLGKRAQDVSILFADVTGYSRLNETMAPEIVAMLVERYFSNYLDILHEHGGDISETSGDGLMAIFQDGDRQVHAERAVQAALELQWACARLNRENSVQELDIHIGVNSGSALVGSTRFTGKHNSRWIFTADGPATNLAARLANLASSGEIYIGAETANRLSDNFEVEYLDSRILKNIVEPVDIHAVKGLRKRSNDDQSIKVQANPPAASASERRMAVVLAIRHPDVESVTMTDSVMNGHGKVLMESDGVMLVEFGGVIDALSCGIKILKGSLDRNNSDDANQMPALGLAIGHLERAKGTTLGPGTRIPQALAGVAAPGDLVFSDQIYESAPGEFRSRLISAGRISPEAAAEEIPYYKIGIGDADLDARLQVLGRFGRPSVDSESESADNTAGDKALGLPWPKDYLQLRSELEKRWDVSGEIYLGRQLSGKSGALVFTCDISCQEFKGLGILKLDSVDGKLDRDNPTESARHQVAIRANSEFAEAHLPRLVATARLHDSTATLTTIAASGLEYAKPLSELPYQQRLAFYPVLALALLADWNDGHQLLAGLQSPRDIISSLLGYRLDPATGRIHQHLKSDIGIESDVPTITFSGTWLPNPVAFAGRELDLHDDLRIRAIAGQVHGDLHANNILVSKIQDSTEYYLIDLAMYENGQFLFYDHAYFELTTLLRERADVSLERWQAILNSIGYTHNAPASDVPEADDLGLVDLLGKFNQNIFSWIKSQEPNRIPFMESQHMVARIAAGLSFLHKTVPVNLRTKSFVYSASCLKHYLNFHKADWPDKGPQVDID